MNPAGSQERTESSTSERGTRIERYAGRSGDHSLGRALGYFILRLSLGVDMLMHYVVRTWGISQDFVPVTEKMFVGNLLPMSWVHVFLTVLPYFEGLLGVLLVLGLWSRWALTAEGLLVTVLRHSAAIGLDRRFSPDDLSALCFHPACCRAVRLLFTRCVSRKKAKTSVGQASACRFV
jgi:uncharacterized membrane protein YphA (DoxX/SURF4 family)